MTIALTDFLREFRYAFNDGKNGHIDCACSNWKYDVEVICFNDGLNCHQSGVCIICPHVEVHVECKSEIGSAEEHNDDNKEKANQRVKELEIHLKKNRIFYVQNRVRRGADFTVFSESRHGTCLENFF